MIRGSRLQKPDGPDNFEFALTTGFKGYVSSVDPTNCDPELLVRGSQNVYRKISGTIANRPGRKLYDVLGDATIAGIVSGYVWQTSLGATLPLRIVNYGASTAKLQVYSNITGSYVWYDLLTGMSKTRFVFDSWWDNTDKKDKLLFVRGDSNLFDWSGGIGTIDIATSGAATIGLKQTSSILQGFASTGSVVINGTTYTYTGRSGATLTGVSPSPLGEADGSAVVATLVTNTTTPASGFTNDFLRVVNNQLYVGSYSSRLVYMSKSTSYTDYTQSTPRVPGEGNTFTLDDVGMGIGVRQGTAHIFGGTSSLYIPTFSQITVGTTLTEQIKVQKIQLGNLISAKGHEFIDVLSDNIIYLDQSQQLRSFGTFRNLNTAKAVLLSQPVQQELTEIDFTLGAVKVISDQRGDIVYITAPNSGTAYMYQERTALDPAGNVISERLWQPPQILGISRVDSIGGRIVGFSNSNPQIYYIWDTGQWHDDIPSDSAPFTTTVPYTSVMIMAYQNGGRRTGKINFDKTYFEGYATLSSYLYGAVYYDYQGAEQIHSLVLNSPSDPFKKLFSGVTPPSLGDASMGDNPLGDGLVTSSSDQALIPKFKEIIDVGQVDTFEFAIMVYSSDIDSRWEILSFGTNFGLSQIQAIEIRK